ncbi:MAG TPA: hypothetical protein VD970_18220 [Acetobacteraceae bacterium]|nr:hypothetical protein [Acetobacteraceae bacterium]
MPEARRAPFAGARRAFGAAALPVPARFGVAAFVPAAARRVAAAGFAPARPAGAGFLAVVFRAGAAFGLVVFAALFRAGAAFGLTVFAAPFRAGAALGFATARFPVGFAVLPVLARLLAGARVLRSLTPCSLLADGRRAASDAAVPRYLARTLQAAE